MERTVSNEDPTKRLIKAFSDAIPMGEHPAPHAEWITVRLDFINEAIDHLDWLEHGIAEWQDEAMTAQKQADGARATARIAIGHITKVLNDCRTADEQQAADTAARDWLASIGQ